MPDTLKIAFLHPDLGLGGAERLIVDAALELQAAGHRVTLFTASHDPARAFPETVDGSLSVQVRGRLLPAHVLQRLRAPCGIARAAWLATALRPGRFDVVVCDLVAHAIPLARALGRTPIVFYCHYPDRLLAPHRGGLYRWYRAPIDRLEEHATGMADRVLVNSRFTATRFREAFPRLAALALEVVYPGVALAADEPEPAAGSTLLCISRFDPAKRLERAVDALADLRRTLAPEAFAPVRLVIAGGYDARLRESRETVERLQALARRLDLADRVELIRSPSDAVLRAQLSRARCVVYTPEDEHFGLVPLEAMAAGRPVVAVSRGGPAETIRDGETGFLCEPTPAAFAAALARLIGDPERAERMGQAGRAHVARHFSRAAFGARFDAVVRDVARGGREVER